MHSYCANEFHVLLSCIVLLCIVNTKLRSFINIVLINSGSEPDDLSNLAVCEDAISDINEKLISFIGPKYWQMCKIKAAQNYRQTNLFWC